MDGTDEKIIAELTRNARISHSDLAGKVLLSRNACASASNVWSARATSPTTPSSTRATTPAMSSALVLVYRQDARPARRHPPGLRRWPPRA